MELLKRIVGIQKGDIVVLSKPQVFNNRRLGKMASEGWRFRVVSGVLEVFGGKAFACERMPDGVGGTYTFFENEIVRIENYPPENF